MELLIIEDEQSLMESMVQYMEMDGFKWISPEKLDGKLGYNKCSTLL